jgi:hypothetical protein
VPRFYFDIDDGSGPLLDDDGIDAADLASAKAKAVDALRSMARDVVQASDRHVVAVDVRDESGQVRIRATLTLAVATLPG